MQDAAQFGVRTQGRDGAQIMAIGPRCSWGLLLLPMHLQAGSMVPAREKDDTYNKIKIFRYFFLNLKKK